MESQQTIRRFPNAHRIVVILLGWIGFYFYYAHLKTSSPSVPDPLTGRTIPLKDHGAVLYISATEQVLFFGLLAAGPVAMVLIQLVQGILRGRTKARESSEIVGELPDRVQRAIDSKYTRANGNREPGSGSRL